MVSYNLAVMTLRRVSFYSKKKLASILKRDRIKSENEEAVERFLFLVCVLGLFKFGIDLDREKSESSNANLSHERLKELVQLSLPVPSGEANTDCDLS